MKKIFQIADNFSKTLMLNKLSKVANKFAEEEEEVITDRIGIPDTIEGFPLTEVPETAPAGTDPDVGSPFPPPVIVTDSISVPSDVEWEGIQNGLLNTLGPDLFGSFLAEKYFGTPAQIINLQIDGFPLGVFKKEKSEIKTPTVWQGGIHEDIYKKMFENTQVYNADFTFDEFMNWAKEKEPVIWSHIIKNIQRYNRPSSEGY